MVVIKNPADFIGDYLGKSEVKTKAILEASVVNVLVIDEAYMLDPGDTNKGDMFRNANQGLSRWFPIDQPFRFENFNIDQLEQILQLKMQDQDFTCTEQAIEVASNVLRGALERPNHTNAGEVDSLLQRAKLNYTN